MILGDIRERPRRRNVKGIQKEHAKPYLKDKTVNKYFFRISRIKYEY